MEIEPLDIPLTLQSISQFGGHQVLSEFTLKCPTQARKEIQVSLY